MRGYLTRTRFRKATELGRRQAARAAAVAAKHNAATAIQKHVRRRIAQRKARAGCSHNALYLVRRLPPAWAFVTVERSTGTACCARKQLPLELPS